MPINQGAIADLIALSNPANMSGRKMWVHDGGNLATAMRWFKKITGAEFDFIPKKPGEVGLRAARPTDSGFWFLTVTEGKISVTLRSGSSSVLDGAWVAPENTYPTSPAYGQPAFRYPDPQDKQVTEPIPNKTWGQILKGAPEKGRKEALRNPHDGPPTIEMFDARELRQVDVFTPFRSANKSVIVEVKFTTRPDQRAVTIK